MKKERKKTEENWTINSYLIFNLQVRKYDTKYYNLIEKQY